MKRAGEFSVYHQSMIEVLAYAGPRIDEFRRLKWKHVDFENNKIALYDPNMTKGARPRFVPIPAETSRKLKEIYNLGLHKSDSQRIWGSRMYEKDIRNFIKECARRGHVKYSAVHDFRRHAVSYHIKQIEKQKLTKLQVAQGIMNHVSGDPRLNPIVVKQDPKRDKKGNIIYKTKKGGQRYPAMEPRMENGQVVTGPKYTLTELMERRFDYLKNVYVAQILGHNRSDSTSTYKS